MAVADGVAREEIDEYGLLGTWAHIARPDVEVEAIFLFCPLLHAIPINLGLLTLIDYLRGYCSVFGAVEA